MGCLLYILGMAAWLLAANILFEVWQYFSLPPLWYYIVLGFGTWFVFFRETEEDTGNGNKNVRLSSSEIEYLNTVYCQKALRFLEYCELLVPDKLFFIITPAYIGVEVSNSDDYNYFGTSVMSHLMSCRDQPQFKDMFFDKFLEREKENLGGDEGVALFRQLKLKVCLHDNDDDSPVIYMELPEFDASKRAQYAKALQKQYNALYHNNLKIFDYIWDDNY